MSNQPLDDLTTFGLCTIFGLFDINIVLRLSSSFTNFIDVFSIVGNGRYTMFTFLDIFLRNKGKRQWRNAYYQDIVYPFWITFIIIFVTDVKPDG